jgi:hypothetical protein
MSSRKLEGGLVEITAPVYGDDWPIGHRLSATILGLPPAGVERFFEDYRRRLVLSESSNGHAWGEGVTVQPPDGALEEAVANGSLHRSLVEEPRAA